jgi:ABC-type multidrug transport system ATPase subunit
VSIFVSNLSKNYGQQKAVNNISFSLKKMKLLAFSDQMELANPPQ